MGTSADRTAGTGGSWTSLKRASTQYVRGLGNAGSTDRARVVLARHVPLLGGASGATATAVGGRAGVQGLGGFLADLSHSGLEGALRAAGLADLVGCDRYDLIDPLITKLVGTGSDLDSSAARDALCDVLEELFAGADTWEELSDPGPSTVDADHLLHLLESYLAHYIYNRIPVIAERLGRIADPAALRQADRDIRTVIEDCVTLKLREIDEPLRVDWRGPDGTKIANAAMEYAYQVAAALDDDSEVSNDFFTRRFAALRAQLADSLRRDQAAGIVRDDVSPEAVAALLIAASDGLQTHWLLDPTIPLAETLRVFDVFLRSREPV